MTQFQTGTKLEMSECPECLQDLSLLEYWKSGCDTCSDDKSDV